MHRTVVRLGMRAYHFPLKKAEIKRERGGDASALAKSAGDRWSLKISVTKVLNSSDSEIADWLKTIFMPEQKEHKRSTVRYQELEKYIETLHSSNCDVGPRVYETGIQYLHGRKMNKQMDILYQKALTRNIAITSLTFDMMLCVTAKRMDKIGFTNVMRERSTRYKIDSTVYGHMMLLAINCGEPFENCLQIYKKSLKIVKIPTDRMITLLLSSCDTMNQCYDILKMSETLPKGVTKHHYHAAITIVLNTSSPIPEAMILLERLNSVVYGDVIMLTSAINIIIELHIRHKTSKMMKTFELFQEYNCVPNNYSHCLLLKWSIDIANGNKESSCYKTALDMYRLHVASGTHISIKSSFVTLAISVKDVKSIAIALSTGSHLIHSDILHKACQLLVDTNTSIPVDVFRNTVTMFERKKIRGTVLT